MKKKLSTKAPRKGKTKSYSRSAHNCLDPLLLSSARLARKEKKGDLQAALKRLGAKRPRSAASMARERGSAIRVPAAVTGLPRGLQALAAQSSSYATARLKRNDTVQVLVMLKGARSTAAAGRQKVARQIAVWRGKCVALSPTTLAVNVPRRRLHDLAALSQVKLVEGSRRLKPNLNLAHVSAGLQDTQHNWNVTETGDGVLVGIVDTGIDASHPGFGTGSATRIVDYLDQTTNRHYSQSDIAAGKASASPDVDGHGTHVAGIAAGSGAGSTNKQFEGVAPNADIAMVKTTFDTGDIAAGIAHLFDVAGQRGQPCVVNLSLGGHYGAHDGSSILERAIDELSGPGRVLVVSAGNEGSDRIHAGVDLKPEDDRWVADFDLIPGVVDGVQMGFLYVQVWTQWEDDLRVQLRSPNGELFEAPTEDSAEFDRSAFAVEAIHQRGVYNEDHATTFQVVTIPQPQWLRGWSIIVTPRTTGGIRAGCVHAWIPDELMGRFTSGYTKSHLVGMPGTAFSAITVASHATRDNWPSQDAEFAGLDAINLEEISYFSSPGPTRENSNKPEISAPGQWIVSALSQQASLEDMPAWVRLSGGKYAALQGTSMASPYVAGAVALLLERKGDLDWAEIKRRLIKSARQDQFSSCTWNTRWGFGKLDVQRLLAVEPE